ncbi:MAG: YjdF family protein [Candidatus Fimimonas sp.]
MEVVNTKITATVLFENAFWVAVLERQNGNAYEVCKITFGAEPKDVDVWYFLLTNWHKLKFSPSVQTENVVDRKINPKRMQRNVSAQLQNKGIVTKAQQALKLQHEQIKKQRKAENREQKYLQKQEKFSLRQQKKKEKHKGR